MKYLLVGAAALILMSCSGATEFINSLPEAPSEVVPDYSVMTNSQLCTESAEIQQNYDTLKRKYESWTNFGRLVGMNVDGVMEDLEFTQTLKARVAQAMEARNIVCGEPVDVTL